MAQPSTTTPPPLTAENHLSPPFQSALIKQEPQDPTSIGPSTQKDQQNTQNPQSKQQPPPPTPRTTSPPPSIPITELRNLSSALSAFQSCFNDLQHHLNTLKTAVDSVIIATPPQENANITVSPPKDSLQRSSPIIITTSNPIEEKIGEKSTKCEEETTKDSSSELEILCQTMNGRGLKKYLVSNLNEIHKLREEVPKALKQAPNPAKLVLECSGKFFLQGSKAYVNKDSKMVTGREASVLVLECLLLMGVEENGVEIEKEVKDEADRHAMLWRKRMINEGGVAKAYAIDARGLLLLVGCFGVPKMFKNDDLRDLLRRSHAREISGTLRKSSVLMAKVPEIIEGMIKNKMEVDAVDIAYTFGFEDRFNTQMILKSFLQETLESSRKAKEAAQGSPAGLNEANKKKLTALKSVLKCLEGHKIDPSKLLSGWQVIEEISTLKKDIDEFDKKKREEKTQKRKADEAESAKKLKAREVKRSRHKGQGLQKQKAVGHVNSQRYLMDSGIPGHNNSYSASPSILYAPAAGTGQYAGVYGGMIVDPARHMTNHSAPAAGTGQYAGVYGGMIVDPAGHETNRSVQSYAWRGDPTLTERVVAHSYGGQPSSSSITGLYRPSSSSLEGYVLAPNASSVGVSSRSTSDLYQFADVVTKNEYQPSVGQSHHTSYL